MSELRPRRSLLAAAALLASCTAIAATPIPQVRGPLADTATQGVLVWDVAGAGYVAEEYLVSGKADVYEPVAMADASNMLVRDNVRDMGQRDFTLKTLQKDQPGEGRNTQESAAGLRRQASVHDRLLIHRCRNDDVCQLASRGRNAERWSPGVRRLYIERQLDVQPAGGCAGGPDQHTERLR